MKTRTRYIPMLLGGLLLASAHYAVAQTAGTAKPAGAKPAAGKQPDIRGRRAPPDDGHRAATGQFPRRRYQ